MKSALPFLFCLLLLPAAVARGDSRFADCAISALPPAPPAQGARADTTWLFAPSGLGAYGEAGTDARGYTFDGTGECFDAAWTGEGGPFAQVRFNTYTGGEHASCLWAFFDPDTTETGYPMGVFPYGPPYYELCAQSPPLERGDDGELLELAYGDGPLILNYDVYMDLPLNALVFHFLEVSGRTPGGDYWTFVNPSPAIYYGQFGWETRSVDITEAAFAAIGGSEERLAGVRVRLGFVDMCAEWCGVMGSGYPHTVGGFIDGVQVGLVRTGTAAPASPLPATVLAAPQPNPFNPATQIRFTLAEAGRARLSVCDLAGRRCRELLDADLAAGEQKLRWDGRDDAGAVLASGVYFLELETAAGSFSQKAVLLR